MKKLVIFCFLGCLATAYTYVSLIKTNPIEEVIPEVKTVLQTYSTDRVTGDETLQYYVEDEIVETVVAYPDVELVQPEVYPEGGISWLLSLIDEGKPSVQLDTYEVTYNQADEEISRSAQPISTTVIEAEPAKFSYGAKLDIGTYFISDFATSYGVDCNGCSGQDDGAGGTSAGIQVTTTSVRQSDGTWMDGITYDGYYIIATDKAIPHCTIVEISNHKWSGYGLVPDVPFKALVLDRGGAIDGTDIDLYTGSEAAPVVTNHRRSGIKIEIIGFGKWSKNSLGERACIIK